MAANVGTIDRAIRLVIGAALIIAPLINFMGLGASASLFGQMVREYFDVLRWVAAAIIIVMGLHFLGLGHGLRRDCPSLYDGWGRHALAGAAIAGWASFQLVAPTGVGPWYFIHVFLVSVLLLYFPFSKLLHMPGVFFSPTRNLANTNRTVRHVNPWNPPIVGHTYAEWEDEFRDKLKASGYALEKE